MIQIPFDSPIMEKLCRDILRVKASETTDEVLLRLQHQKITGQIAYLYVVDEENKLVGVVSLHAVVFSPRTTEIQNIMRKNVIALSEEHKVSDACDLFILHRFLAIPVVNKNRELLGVTKIESYFEYTPLIEDAPNHSTQAQLFQLLGVHLEQIHRGSWFSAFQTRMPWLFCNIAGGLLCAILIAFFEELLAAVLVLTFFIPVVLGLAESVAIQSVSIALQEHDRKRKLTDEFLRELLIGLSLGFCSALTVALVGWLWQGNVFVGISLGISILLSVCSSALIGISFPQLLHWIGRDPKVAAGPVALVCADVIALGLYFGIATFVC